MSRPARSLSLAGSQHPWNQETPDGQSNRMNSPAPPSQIMDLPPLFNYFSLPQCTFLRISLSRIGYEWPAAACKSGTPLTCLVSYAELVTRLRTPDGGREGRSCPSGPSVELPNQEKVMSVGQPLSASNTHLGGTKTRFLLLSRQLRFVDVRRPFWREAGSAVYNCCWASPAQSFSGPSPAGLLAILYCLRYGTPHAEGEAPGMNMPPEQGGPVMPSGTEFPFPRLLRFAGRRWRYSKPPPQGI
jgi:hypothetical protein